MALFPTETFIVLFISPIILSQLNKSKNEKNDSIFCLNGDVKTNIMMPMAGYHQVSHDK